MSIYEKIDDLIITLLERGIFEDGMTILLTDDEFKEAKKDPNMNNLITIVKNEHPFPDILKYVTMAGVVYLTRAPKGFVYCEEADIIENQ